MKLASFTAAMLVLTSLGLPARGQCLDWTPGFGPSGEGMDDIVRALLTADLGSGPRLYAGGRFTTAGGVSTGSFAEWDGGSWNDLGAGFAQVFDIEFHDDGSGPSLFVAGAFSSIGGVSTRGVARWDGTAWHAVGWPGIATPVYCLQSIDLGSGPVLIAGGNFIAAGGFPAANIAQWDGSNWTPLGSGINGYVYELAAYDDGAGTALFAGGGFLAAGGQVVSRIARWDGATWSALPGPILGSQPQVQVRGMTVADLGAGPVLVVGGSINTIGAVRADGVATWDGTAWTGLPLDSSATVTALTTFDDGSGPALYAGGRFTDPDNVLVGHVARWNGMTWDFLGNSVWGGSGGDPVLALASLTDAQGPGLWAGGTLQFAGGYSSSYIARWGASCSSPTIIQQPPKSVVAEYIGNEQLEIACKAQGTSQVLFRWHRNGVPLLDGGHVTGASTDTLSLTNWSWSDAGDYHCVVSNAHGSTSTDIAVMTVPAVGRSGEPWALDPLVQLPAIVSGLPAGALVTELSSARPTSVGSATVGARLATQERALLHWDGTGLEAVTWQGGPVPGLRITFTIVEPARLVETAGAEGVLVKVQIAGPGVGASNNDMLLFRDGTAIDVIAREGDPVPGEPAGTTWDSFSWLRMAAPDKAYFFGGTVIGATGTHYGLFSWTRAGGLVLELDYYAPPPGAPGATTTLLYSGYDIDRSGRWVVTGRIDQTTGPNPSGQTDSVMWVSDPSGPLLAVRSGDAAPGYPAGAVLEDFALLGTRADQAGGVVFESRVVEAGGNYTRAMYRWTSVGLERLVAEGQIAPGAPAGTVFRTAQPTAATADGKVLFFAHLLEACPTTCAREGFFLLDSTGITPVALDRPTPLPGLPPLFSFEKFIGADLNPAGQVALQVQVGGLAPKAEGCFGWTRESGLFPMIVPGLQVDRGGLGDYYTCTGGGSGQQQTSSVANSLRTLSDDGRVWSSAVPWGGTSSDAVVVDMLDYEALWDGPGVSVCAGDAAWGGCPCGNAGSAGEGCANSTGVGAILESAGSRSVSADDAAFTCSQMPPLKVALLIQGSSASAGLPFQDGRICVGGAIRRLSLVSAGPQGQAEFGAGHAAKGNWVPGQTHVFQGWYRDGQGPCQQGANLTQALAVTFTP